MTGLWAAQPPGFSVTPGSEELIVDSADEGGDRSRTRPVRGAACFVMAVVACAAAAMLFAAAPATSLLRSQVQVSDGGSMAIGMSDRSLRRSGQTPPNKMCTFLWQLGINDLIAQGWGDQVLWMGTMYVRFHDWMDTCAFAMSDAALHDYKAWGLDPPGESVPADIFDMMLTWSVEGMDGITSVLGPLPSGAEAVDNQWKVRLSSQMQTYQDLAGCWKPFDDFVWTTFKRIVHEPSSRPTTSSYIGMHIRHGDKVAEGFTVNLNKLMDVVHAHPSWNATKSVWVATDDSNVIEEEMTQYTDHTFHWYNQKRNPGGEPDTGDQRGIYHHNHNSGAIKGVLDDTLMLAHASVLIGSFNSQFFKVGWLLNYLRRTPEERKEAWCWDAFSMLPCHDRHDFVVQFVEIAKAAGSTIYVDEMRVLDDCLVPFQVTGMVQVR